MHEVLHYFVGTRYFPELGYAGLYDAVAVADLEDAATAVRANAPMRDLASNRTENRRERARRAQDEVRAAFAPARWEAFKRDVAELRRASTPDVWQTATLDHGYNGTPLVTALLGGVAHLPGLTAGALLRAVVWLDPLLVAGLGALVWRLAGATSALAFLFFTLANPLNDHAFVGASYLRYGYFLALAGAALALRRGAFAASGALLALSGWLRLFPLALWAALAARDALSRRWRERLREGRRLHAAFAITTLAIAALTAALPTPDGRNAWVAFAEKIRLHAGTSGINQAWLGTPITYAAEVERLQVRGDESWAAESARVRRERAPWILGAALAGLAFALATLARVGRAAALVPGLLAVFCAFPMTHYYWSVLAAIPLALPRDARLQRGLLALFAALALTAAPGVLEERRDLQFALWSAELGAFLVWACAALWRRPEDGD